MLNIRMMLPIMINGARVPIRKEICTMRWMTLESLERRTINWPVFRRSRLPKEKDWILRKRASRRSRATLSPTCTE